MITNKRILIISPEAWGIQFVSKHHYAQCLAAQGNTVYFLNPPSNTNQIQTLAPNLYLIDYKPLVRGLNRLPKFLNRWMSQRIINNIYNNYIQTPLDIVWSFDPFRFQWLDAWRAKVKIYHPVDIHATNLEYEIAQSADFVLSVSDNILSKFVRLRLPQTFKITHGLAAHFLGDIPYDPIISFSYKKKIGYVGNLFMQAIDREMLLTIIQSNPVVDFYFVGACEAKDNNLSTTAATDFIESLRKCPNVILLGAKPSAQIPGIIKHFDMFLFCYKDNPPLVDNPHKILEYLSTGNVIVASPISEYRDHSELLAMADKNSELPNLFKKVLDNIEDYNCEQARHARQAYAYANTYAKQLERIYHIIKGKL